MHLTVALLLLITTMGYSHSLGLCTVLITPPTTVLPYWILTWSWYGNCLERLQRENLIKNVSDSSSMAMGLPFIGCREVPLKTSKHLERRSAHMFYTSDGVTICLLGLATCFGQ